MKKWHLIFVACVVVLSGCAHFQDARPGLDGFNPNVVRQPQPRLPNIFVVGNKFLVVDQEPIRISRRDVGQDGRVTISWALAAGSPYTFTDRGITFAPGPNKERDTPVDLKCGVQGVPRKIFECSYRPSPGRSVFKYTINAQNRENPRDVIEPLDPYIVNDA